MRDIGCVAVIGIIAHEQRSGLDALKDYADVRDDGKRWAGLVGQRIMDESGQPREVVAFAIKQSVDAEQARAIKLESATKAKAYARTRFDECKAVMDADLAAADAPAMTDAATVSGDEPSIAALHRQQLDEDLSTPHRIRYCKAMIDLTAAEIAGREGSDSRDANAFARLADAFAVKAKSLPNADKPKAISADGLMAELEKEPRKEEKMARCIRLGETLALALPPE